jgi:hypothetical protein
MYVPWFTDGVTLHTCPYVNLVRMPELATTRLPAVRAASGGQQCLANGTLTQPECAITPRRLRFLIGRIPFGGRCPCTKGRPTKEPWTCEVRFGYRLRGFQS